MTTTTNDDQDQQAAHDLARIEATCGTTESDADAPDNDGDVIATIWGTV